MQELILLFFVLIHREALRSWVLQASNDESEFAPDSSWVTLRDHVDDKSLSKKGQAFTWDIHAQDEGFSKFRSMFKLTIRRDVILQLFFSKPYFLTVKMTGMNSNKHFYLACSGVEFYGTMTGTPMQPTTAGMLHWKKLCGSFEKVVWFF